MKARFIYRDGKFWFRVGWVEIHQRRFRNVEGISGPFATLRAAWDARFGS